MGAELKYFLDIYKSALCQIVCIFFFKSNGNEDNDDNDDDVDDYDDDDEYHDDTI